MKRRLWVMLAIGAVAAVGGVVAVTAIHGSSSGSSTSAAVGGAKPDAAGVASETVAWVKQEVDKGALVLDVRKDDEWAAGRMPDSVHIPLAQVQDRFSELPKGRLIITVCKDGGRSYKAAYALHQEGYQAVNLAGGLTAWAAAGLPVVTDSGAPGQIL